MTATNAARRTPAITISLDLQIPSRYLINVARSARTYAPYWPEPSGAPISPEDMARGIQTLFGSGAFPALRGAIAQDIMEGWTTANVDLDDANLIAQLGRFGRVRYSAAFLTAAHRRRVEADRRGHSERLRAGKVVSADAFKAAATRRAAQPAGLK